MLYLAHLIVYIPPGTLHFFWAFCLFGSPNLWHTKMLWFSGRVVPLHPINHPYLGVHCADLCCLKTSLQGHYFKTSVFVYQENICLVMNGLSIIYHVRNCWKVVTYIHSTFFHRGSVYREYLSGFLKFRGLVSLIFEK